jgi:hypothetical protein
MRRSILPAPADIRAKILLVLIPDIGFYQES